MAGLPPPPPPPQAPQAPAHDPHELMTSLCDDGPNDEGNDDNSGGSFLVTDTVYLNVKYKSSMRTNGATTGPLPLLSGLVQLSTDEASNCESWLEYLLTEIKAQVAIPRAAMFTEHVLVATSTKDKPAAKDWKYLVERGNAAFMTTTQRLGEFAEFDFGEWIRGGAPGPILIEEMTKSACSSVQMLDAKKKAQGRKRTRDEIRHPRLVPYDDDDCAPNLDGSAPDLEGEHQRRLNALRTLTLNRAAEKAGTATATPAKPTVTTATPAKPIVTVISRILHDARPSMSDEEKEAVKTYLMPKLKDDSELARLESKVDLYNPSTYARVLAEQLVTACGGGAAFF